MAGKRWALTAAAMLGLLAGSGAFAANVDTVYHNGKIYTMSDLRSGDTYDFGKARDLKPENAIMVEVVAVKDGRIVFAGSMADAEAQGMLDAAKTVDLQGRTMLPGFFDGHGHFPGQGADDLYKVFLGSPPLGTMTSIEDYKAALNVACENAREGDGVLGSGYDDTLITDRRHPTWMDIDAAPACKGKDVRLAHISGHVAVASNSLLVKAGLMSEDGTPTDKARNTPGVVIDSKTDKVTGVLMETVAMTSVGSPTVTQDLQKSLARANEVYLAKGVTLADSGASMFMGSVDGGSLQMQTGLDKGNLSLRVALHPILNAAYYGAGNLISLHWQGLDNNTQATSQQMVNSGFGPAEDSPKIGQDVTRFNFLYAPFERSQSLPDNYLFLGAYKILGDGSPQAYTAWMKDPGNYDWEDYTAQDRFALGSPILGTKYDTTANSAAPTEPPYFNGLAGTVNVYPQDLQNLLEVVHRAGHSTEIHCNGSAYAEAWIEALEKTISRHPNISDTRHTSIHAQTFERNMLERITGNYDTVDPTMTTQLFGALGRPDAGQPSGSYDASAVNGKSREELSALMKQNNIIPNYFVTHTYFYGERHRDKFFGPGRANNISPVGWSIAYGTPYVFHNDTDVTPIDPMQSVESAVTRQSARSLVSPGGQVISGHGKDLDATVTLPSRKDASGPIAGSEMRFYDYDQRINVAQALVGVTIGAAYQNKLDDRMGSIEPGKFADFVILDDDPMLVADIDATRLSDIRVTSTIVGGQSQYGVMPGEAVYMHNVRASFMGNDGVEIAGVRAEAITDEARLRPLDQGQTRYGALNLAAAVSPSDSVALFQMHVLGNGAPASAFQLYVDGNACEYGRNDVQQGHFWFADASAPTIPLASEARLGMDGDYIAFFTIRPEASNGEVNSSVELVSNGQAPRNRTSVAERSSGGDDDDDSSGCTIGSKPAYDLGILAAMFLGLFGLRGLRRRLSGKA